MLELVYVPCYWNKYNVYRWIIVNYKCTCASSLVAHPFADIDIDQMVQTAYELLSSDHVLGSSSSKASL